MATQAALGATALANQDYKGAIDHLTSALTSSPSPLWLINRSTAYQRSGQHELALIDAGNAVIEAVSRARREQIATAQFRRAVALHGLKRFGDARLCLNWCRKYNEKEKALGIWQAKVKNDYEQAGGEDAEANRCTVKEIPDKVEEVGTAEEAEKSVETTKANGNSATPKDTPIPVATPTQTPKEKIRHEWYQSNTNVTITIFAKGIPKDQAEIILEEGNLEVRFPVLTSNSTYDFTISPLFSRIDPTKSSSNITPNKIEILLQKSTPGLKWSSLEGTEAITSSTSEAPANKIPTSVLSDKTPSYPTSSRNGPKDWDKVASSALKASKPKGKENEEHEDDEFDEESDPVNGFFKKMFKNADDDTKKAMMKSYQESNGTALSTSWADVSKGPVKTEPPEGLVAKKWGE